MWSDWAKCTISNLYLIIKFHDFYKTHHFQNSNDEFMSKRTISKCHHNGPFLLQFSVNIRIIEAKRTI